MGKKALHSPEQVERVEKILRRVSNIVKQKGRVILHNFPITPPQFTALLLLNEEGDMTIGELSQKMHLACSTVTDLLDRMEKSGLIERIRSSQDRRVVKVHILRKGEEIILDVLKARREYLGTVLDHMSAEEVDQVDKALHLIADHMDQIQRHR